MLIDFSFSNFRSFKEEATLDMLASIDKEHPENTIKLEKFSLLKSAFIFGANGAGKSNAIQALRFMKNMVLRSLADLSPNKPIPVEPFKLDNTSANQPTAMEVRFIANNIVYRYGFKVNHEHVLEEWLHRKGKGRWVTIFEKEAQNFSFHKEVSEAQLLLDKGMLRENTLLLTALSTWNNKTAKVVFAFFEGVRFVSSIELQELVPYTLKLIDEWPALKKQVLEAMNHIDVGVQDIHFAKKSWEKFSEPMTDDLKGFFEAQNGPLDGIDFYTDIKFDRQVFNEHHDVVGVHQMDFETEESQGTKNLFGLLGPLIEMLENGGVLLIDEVDTSMHSTLISYIFKFIHYYESSSNSQTQVVVTTHDASQLKSAYVRRDQIFFVDKDKYGASEMYSLFDFVNEDGKKPRKDENFEGAYLAGKYGAIPFISYM